jgi:hypothetical protein
VALPSHQGTTTKHSITFGSHHVLKHAQLLLKKNCALLEDEAVTAVIDAAARAGGGERQGGGGACGVASARAMQLTVGALNQVLERLADARGVVKKTIPILK